MDTEKQGVDASADTQDAPGRKAWTPPASQAELDRIVSDRVARERAKYSDYDDLKAKAAKLDEIEQANLSELEKERASREAAEAERDELLAEKQVSAWKAEVAEATGVPAAALAGATKEEIEAHAETLRPLLTQPSEQKGAIGPYVPSEGTGAGTPTSNAELFAAAVGEALR